MKRNPLIIGICILLLVQCENKKLIQFNTLYNQGGDLTLNWDHSKSEIILKEGFIKLFQAQVIQSQIINNTTTELTLLWKEGSIDYFNSVVKKKDFKMTVMQDNFFEIQFSFLGKKNAFKFFPVLDQSFTLLHPRLIFGTSVTEFLKELEPIATQIYVQFSVLSESNPSQSYQPANETLSENNNSKLNTMKPSNIMQQSILDNDLNTVWKSLQHEDGRQIELVFRFAQEISLRALLFHTGNFKNLYLYSQFHRMNQFDIFFAPNLSNGPDLFHLHYSKYKVFTKLTDSPGEALLVFEKPIKVQALKFVFYRWYAGEQDYFSITDLIPFEDKQSS